MPEGFLKLLKIIKNMHFFILTDCPKHDFQFGLFSLFWEQL